MKKYSAAFLNLHATHLRIGDKSRSYPNGPFRCYLFSYLFSDITLTVLIIEATDAYSRALRESELHKSESELEMACTVPHWQRRPFVGYSPCLLR